MTAIFISHRSADNAEAPEIKDWLGREGHEQLFLDFDPADGIPAGVDWEQRLYQELRRCQALLIVLTPAWLESKWCGNELAIAREKGKAVFVVRVKACPGGPIIPAIQEVDLTLDRAAGLEKLARGLSEHGLDPRDIFDWKPDRPIYPGLAAFDVDDAAIFFGRSEESWQVVEALRRMRLQAAGSPKLLLITGASGSGKSSLMRAGVLARLRKEPASWITARPFRRGTDALAALADALAWAFPAERRPTSLEAITARLAGPDGERQLLALSRELRLALDRPDATLVLVLDQAEELLAAERGDDATKLLDLFRATLAVVGNEILVIATIRSDRLATWQQHASIKAAADHGELPFEMLPLGPMPMARIGEIVRGPAAYEELRIDDDLVDAIRADTLTPDALPLLAYTLQYLHRHFAKDGRLTLAEYRSFGGLEGSVRSQADAAIPIERLSEEDRRALQEAFVPGLVEAAEDGFSRSRAPLATLPARAEPYLRRLIDEARLLTTDSDPQGGVTIEVAHESLLSVWPALARWIAEDAQSLRQLKAMQRAAHDWAQAGRGEDFLVHRDHRLSDAETLIAEPRFAARLDSTDRDYLAACRNAQNRREAAEKEAQERELRTAQALAEEQKAKAQEQKAKTQRTRVLLAVAVALTIAAGWQWWVATEQKEEAQSQLVRANAAIATGLWNDLDFASGDWLTPTERIALWTLAMDDGLVRAEFVRELSGNEERMQRFGRHPGPVLRAFGLRWPLTEEAQTVFERALAAIGDTTAPPQLLTLAMAVKALAGQLNATQAQTALGLVLDAIDEDTIDSAQLVALAAAVQALAPKLTGEHADEALRPMLAGIERVFDPDRLLALALAVEALPVQLDRTQAQAALGPVLEDFERRFHPDELEALAAAVQALAGKLDGAEAQAALGTVLDAIESPPDPYQLRALAKAVRALPVQLTARQFQAALVAVFDAIEGTTDPDHLQVLAEAVQVLAVQLTARDVQAVLHPVFDAIKATTDPGQLRALAKVARLLAGQLDARQAQAAFGPILAAIKGTIDSAQLEALAAAVQALAGKLDAPEAQAALGPMLSAIKSTTNPDQLEALAAAVHALAGKVEAPETQAMLDAINDADPLLAQELAAAVHALEELGPVLVAIKGAGIRAIEFRELPWRDQALIAKLDAQEAQEMFVPSVFMMNVATDADQLEALAAAIQALAGKLDAARAQAVLVPVLDAIEGTTNLDQLRAQAAVVHAVASKLTPEHAQAGLERVVLRLAWAQTSNEATLWAGALVTLLPREPPEAHIEQIVQALKYPTSAGPATDVLLDALRDIDPNAPGKEAGLTVNLDWLTTTYPAIDLDAPPVCPPPLPHQQDLACPVGGA